MRERAPNVIRAALCAMLLASAFVAAAAEPHPSDPTYESPSKDRSAALIRISSRLHPYVHPAADPLFGTLWSISRRLIMPVSGVEPADLKDSFMQPRPTNRVHHAIDIAAPRNTPVVAVTDGIVLRLTKHDSGGTTLYLLAPDNRTLFYYAHLERYARGLKAGVSVRQGDVIAYVGDTGNAQPGHCHLHFEVMTAPDPARYWAGRPRNPYPLLKRVRG